MQAIGSSYQYSNSHNNYPKFGNDYASARQNSTDDDSSEKLAMSAGGLGVISLLINKFSQFLAFKMSNGKEFTSEKNVHEVANQMLKDNQLEGKVAVGYINHQNKSQFIDACGPGWADSFETVARGQNAFYSDGLKLAVAPETKPSLMLHELGHAINSSKGKFMQFLQKSRGWATAVPTALLVLNGVLGNDKDGKKNFVEKNAGLIGFSAFLPTIIEEGMASLRGINAAEVLGNKANLNILRRNYALAWGTYLLAGVGLGLAAKQSVMTPERRS